MMNFRQRMGWISVGLYLLASAAVFYYVFEINQKFNRLTLDVVEKAAAEAELPGELSSASSSALSAHGLYARLLSFPSWVWATLFLLLYLQVFLFLYSCTRTDPKNIGYCILPICLAILCSRHQTFVKASNQISRLQLTDT